MKRPFARLGAAALVLTLLSGCGGRGAAPADSQVHAPEVGAPAPAEQPAPVQEQQAAAGQPARNECDEAGQGLTEMLPALLKRKSADAVMQSPGQWPYCVAFHTIAGTDGLLAYVRNSASSAPPAAIAWQEEGNWRTARVVLPDRGQKGYIGDGAVIFNGGRPSLLLAVYPDFAAGASSLMVGQYEAPGVIKMNHATGVTGKAYYAFLRPDLVLLTYRGVMPGPIAPACEACTPINNQKLWEWNGVQLKLLGERLFPDPLLTASLFLGRLQHKDQAAARLYVTPPDLLPDLVAAVGAPDGWQLPAYSDALGEVRYAESRNWDLLPAPLRLQLPPDNQSLEIKLSKGQATLYLKLVRKQDGWMIVGFHR